MKQLAIRTRSKQPLRQIYGPGREIRTAQAKAIKQMLPNSGKMFIIQKTYADSFVVTMLKEDVLNAPVNAPVKLTNLQAKLIEILRN